MKKIKNPRRPFVPVVKARRSARNLTVAVDAARAAVVARAAEKVDARADVIEVDGVRVLRIRDSEVDRITVRGDTIQEIIDDASAQGLSAKEIGEAIHKKFEIAAADVRRLGENERLLSIVR